MIFLLCMTCFVLMYYNNMNIVLRVVLYMWLLVAWFQPAFVVHVFPPCEFSMQVVNDHSQGLVEQIHDLAHVIIIITTV